MDIFSPEFCEARFHDCATQQTINVFLWKRIRELKQIYCDWKNNQDEINKKQAETNQDIYAKIADHWEHILKAEKNISDLQDFTKNLSERMDKIEADFVNFTQEVNRLLDLYRTNIDQISKTVNELSIKVEKNRADIADIYTKLSEINRKLDELQIDEILKAFKENEERFNKVNQDIQNLDTKIEKEISDRKEDTKNVVNTIDAVNNKLDQYKLDTDNKINDVVTRIGEVSSNLDKNVIRLDKRIDDEKNTRQAVDENLNTKIDGEIDNRILMDNSLNSKIDDLDLKTARKDTDLQNQINKTNQDLQGEVTNRVAGDKNLQDQIDKIDAHLVNIDSDHVKIISDQEKINNQQTDIIRRLANNEDNITTIGRDMQEVKDTINEEVANLHKKDNEQDERLNAIEDRLNDIVLVDQVQICEAATVYSVDFKNFRFNYMLNASGGLFTCSIQSNGDTNSYLYTGQQRYDASNQTQYNKYTSDGSLQTIANNIGYGNQDTNMLVLWIYDCVDHNSYRLEFYSQKSNKTIKVKVVTA